jgi:hypothetical protein
VGDDRRFARPGLNKGEFTLFGNNQMLAVDPQTGAFRRFLTGPVGCEITWTLLHARRDARRSSTSSTRARSAARPATPKDPRKDSKWP